jgi:hypothetical protein
MKQPACQLKEISENKVKNNSCAFTDNDANSQHMKHKKDNYKSKSSWFQWTPEDVAQAIEDGVFLRPHVFRKNGTWSITENDI